MTNKELNRDIKRLGKRVTLLQENTARFDPDVYYRLILPGGEIAREWSRLYRADSTFTAMNRTSILIMLSINIKFRYEALFMFGGNIDLEKLV